jgi:hypothetical protein
MRTFKTSRYIGKRSIAALTLLLATFLAVAQTSPAQAAATKKVCAPKKCVKVKKSRYCYPGDKCGKRVYRKLRNGEYCSPSVGCVTYKGQDYKYIGGPKMTAKQRSQARKCAASLGVSGLGFIGAGPTGVTILGVVVSAWGCS